MAGKNCCVCDKRVDKGKGTHYRGMLVHKKGCKALAKANPSRYKN